MKLRYLIASLAACVIIAGCSNKGNDSNADNNAVKETANDGNKMVYGLTCDGSTDSILIVYPMDGSDPIFYNTIEAKQKGHIIGKPSIGDWVGLMLNPEDSLEAELVINLDQLKGTWTYTVMPRFKEFQNMSKRMQRRMEQKAIEDMPDSVKQIYMVPREYGFVLKRNSVAQPVGRVYKKYTIDDDSPVEYPEVCKYKSWKVWNGLLILTSGTNDMEKKLKATSEIEPDKHDTLQLLTLTEDTLIAIHKGQTIGFHRQKSALSANAEAQKAANKQSK